MTYVRNRAATRRTVQERELSPTVIESFRVRLLAMKAEAVNRIRAEVPRSARAGRQGDLADQANADLDFELETKERKREHRELAEIEWALARIDNGSFGICAMTGEPIGLRRLEANPTATLSVAAQGMRENAFRH